MAPKCFILFVVFSCSNGVLCQISVSPACGLFHRDCTEWHQWICPPCSTGEQTCERQPDTVTDSSYPGIPCPSVSEKLCPVDCRLGDWSKWSDCTTCGSGGRSRYRAVNQPAVFNGSPCRLELEQVDWECAANDTCDADSCDTAEFKCINGNCLPKSLICNGDDDCGDNSDERNCDKINVTCSTGKPLPQIWNAGQGVDILTNEFKRGILDNTKYHGTCVIIQSNEGDLRKPWNIEDYVDQTDSRKDEFTEEYSSSQEYRNSQKDKYSASLSIGLGILEALVKLVSLSGSQETSTLTEDSASKSSSYFHLEVEIEIASFTTRTGKLLLLKPFVDDIKQLPKHYDFAKYSKLFMDYGTHYISSGTFGGKYKHVLQYSNENISSLDRNGLKRCINFAIAGIPVWKAKVSGDAEYCHDKFSSKNGSALSFASKISTVVVGGSTLTATALTVSDAHTVSAKDYEAWAQTISERPVITSFELAPVTDLLPKHKREYGRRALVDYLKLYDPANCKVSCLNDGNLVVLNEGIECRCVCPFPYHGVGCEKELKKAVIPPISTGVKGIPALWLILSFVCIALVCVS